MITIEYFENGKLVDTLEFANMEHANDEMYSLFFNSSFKEYRDRVDWGFESREEIIEFLNNCESGDLFRWELYPQSPDWEFV